MPSVAIKSGFCWANNVCRFAAIIEKGDFQFLDQCPEATYEGPLDGYDTFSLVVPKGSLWLQFFKDDGMEMVLVRRAGRSTPVQGFASFQLARSWVQQRPLPDHGDTTCRAAGEAVRMSKHPEGSPWARLQS
jgi:hypothetical protein